MELFSTHSGVVDCEQTRAVDGKSYSYWRLRIMYSIMFGYACFYLVRQNFTMAIPSLQSELGFSKAEIGIVISAGAILYGLGKGITGLLGDKSNARYFMSFGLLGSACVSFAMGFTTSWWMLFFFFILNNCFQSMGWPPCARLLTHWFSPKEIGTKWALWNTSQQIGGAIILLLAPILISNYGWRYVFFVPAAICFIMAIVLFNRLRDTPESMGLPPIEAYQGLVNENDVDSSSLSTKEIFCQVIQNRLVWYMCGANFFVYIVRMFMFNWAPTFLCEHKGVSLQLAGAQAAVFDLTGMFGGIIAGYMSDKIFEGRRGRVGFIYMICLCLSVVFLWKTSESYYFLHFIGMMLIGFLVTGPQILVGVAAADFASKKAAGAASGLTGTVGYLGASVAGYGIGTIVDNYSWDAAFAFIAVCALCSAFFFLLTWNHRAKALDN